MINIYNNKNIRLAHSVFVPRYKPQRVEAIMEYYPNDSKSKYEKMNNKQLYAILCSLKRKGEKRWRS